MVWTTELHSNLGKIYLAREKQSKFVVALKTITKKNIARSGTTDLLKNEIEIQSRMRYAFSLSLNVAIAIF